MLFRHTVRHYYLVVEADAFILWMLACDIYIRIEEHHEVRCNLVNVADIFSDYRHIIVYVYWNWRKHVILSVL